ncbi:MAG: hypothetical protein H3Z54_14315 [archaeon]|nr:hypothetical protein [archaeon]
MYRTSRFMAYGIGLLAGFFLSLTAFSIMESMKIDLVDAALISIIPFVIFSGAWILTLRLVFKI